MSTQDPLDRLRAQVEAAHEAAQRVAEQAAASSSPEGAGLPPSGYASPGEQARAGQENPEIRALVGLLEIVRDLLPADVQDQLLELIRELLKLARAIIDLAVSRLERRQPPETEVEDIPLT
jgi:hypothetical protein